jgi:hypothetical protein|tara:strand:- start:27 stop:197 length:171 start_codon:yes stop_codon:yes gene_type:complete
MDTGMNGMIVFSGVGVVVDVVTRIDRWRPRVGVVWNDGGGIDYEPVKWLEVISESR